MNSHSILNEINLYIGLSSHELSDPAIEIRARNCIDRFLSALESGTIRSASFNKGKWQIEPLVKQGILLAFRIGKNTPMPHGPFSFSDKDLLKLQQLDHPTIRLVPGGSSVRRGAYIGPSVTIMPPAYVNVGAFVDEGSMIDSHALVGSCAQIGKRVHISAAAQIGGVLEPISALPVIIEDDVMVGGNCGLYEGLIVKSRAIIAAGVILTSSTRVYDLVNESIIEASHNSPLEIPAGAVVVPGSRTISTPFARQHGLSVYAPLIIKYRDPKTDAKTTLEQALR